MANHVCQAGRLLRLKYFKKLVSYHLHFQCYVRSANLSKNTLFQNITSRIVKYQTIIYRFSFENIKLVLYVLTIILLYEFTFSFLHEFSPLMGKKDIPMKLITCCSFKGGAGKTTALMGLCSAFASKGKRVALFEADENRPLTRWRDNSLPIDTWDDQCAVFVSDEVAALENSYEAAQGDGYDYALADTHGGSSELNNTIIASSDFLLLPSMLTALDVDEALATYRYVIELMMVESLQIPTAILKQRVPVGRLTLSQSAACGVLGQLPQFGQPMHERDAFAAMKQRGMLHRAIAKLADSPSMRLQMRSHQAAMDEVLALSAYIEQALGA